MIRCVHYLPEADAVVVVDRLRAVARTAVVQRWQVAPGVSLSPTADGATLRSGGVRARLLLSGGGNTGLVTASRRGVAAWFTGRYGERLPGAVLTRVAPPGGRRRRGLGDGAGRGRRRAPGFEVAGADPASAAPVTVTVGRAGAAPVTVALPAPPAQP